MNKPSNHLQGSWNYPTTMWFGCGRINKLPSACSMLGMRNPLLVTDPGLAKLPMIPEAIKVNQLAGIATGIFSAIKSNPNGENIDAGVQCYQKGGHDGVIAFGGGSAVDAGKAIALMAEQSLSLWDVEDVGDNWQRVNIDKIAPIIAVPTTAGTGSEVGRASVIVNAAQHRKVIIFHPKMLPGIVISDPQLSVGLPANITAATGMDALSHNLEAYCAPGYHPMAEGIALEGMRLIKQWLPVAYHEPGNLEARSHMLIASSMGATAFQKGLGAMHALAHPLGAIYDAHHGLLNAILMPYVLAYNCAYNRESIEGKMQHLSRVLGLTSASVNAVLDFIMALRKSIDIPNDLQSIGIGLEHVPKIAKMATQDPSAAGNPVLLTEENYAELLTNAINGRLHG
ncbi:MAG: iron-containing alcohol dehydrogenase [Ectothiorhodospiraceae bacterium]|nr:iron-containing alcohol dehydrogenase [Ectothiorhodospiraceae bacterium]